MKRSFFQISLNIITYLLIVLCLTFLLEYGINLSIKFISDPQLINSFTFLIIFKNKLIPLLDYNLYFRVCISIILFIFLTYEFIHRLLFDSILNLFKSIYYTINLRLFLRLRTNSKKQQNQIYSSFNFMTQKSSIDIRRNTIRVYIKMPRSQQAQKLLRDMEIDLKADISYQNPNYYFAEPVRKGNTLWIIGTRR